MAYITTTKLQKQRIKTRIKHRKMNNTRKRTYNSIANITKSLKLDAVIADAAQIVPEI